MFSSSSLSTLGIAALLYGAILCLSLALGRLAQKAPPPPPHSPSDGNPSATATDGAAAAGGGTSTPYGTGGAVPPPLEGAVALRRHGAGGGRGGATTAANESVATPIARAAKGGGGGGGGKKPFHIPAPPVLLMLCVGLATRELFEWHYRRDFLSHFAGPSPPPAELESIQPSTQPQLQALLSVSKPFMLLALATIGLDIGSHLSYPLLVQLRKPLLLFALVFFPVVFSGMLVVIRYSGDVLVQKSARESSMTAFATRGYFEGNNGPRVTPSTLPPTPPPKSGKPPSKLLSPTADAPRRALATAATTNTAKTAAATIPTADSPHDDAAAAVLTTYRSYYAITMWCSAALIACVTVERSSPEFLSGMRNVGVRENGPGGAMAQFLMCVAACQDVMALLLFVVVGSFLRPVELGQVKVLRAVLRQHWQSYYGGATPPGRSAAANASVAAAAAAGLAGGGGGGGAGTGAAAEGSGSALIELLLIGGATLLMALVACLLWAGLRRLAATLQSQERVRTLPTRSFWCCGGGERRLWTMGAVSLLLLLAGVIAWGSVTTPGELLLAAVITGSATHFYRPCPHLQHAIATLQEVTNVLLFTSMGLRTTFSPPPQPPGAAAAQPMAASMPLTLAMGFVLFVSRVACCWLGGYVGALVSQVERRMALVRPSPPPTTTTGAAAANLTGPAGTRTVSASGEKAAAVAPALSTPEASVDAVDDLTACPPTAAVVAPARRWLGLGLITQLAIALALCARVGDEYTAMLRSAGPGLAAGGGQILEPRSVATTAMDAEAMVAKVSPVLSIAPLVQAYTFSIAFSMVAGPLLTEWVLRRCVASDTRRE